MEGMTPANNPAIITLVVPAYNEALLLPRLLDTVDEARRRAHEMVDRYWYRTLD